MSTLSSVNNNQNNQYSCINSSKYRNNVIKEKTILEETEEQTLHLVDIQAFEDLVSKIYIPPTLVCSITNDVGISCSTLKIIFKKLYNDSQFNKLKTFDGIVLELIFSFLIPSDIEKHWDDSMFSKTERLFSTAGVSQSNKSEFDKCIEDQQSLNFSCSYILSRDDEISMKFRASQETVNWISKTGQLPDLNS